MHYDKDFCKKKWVESVLRNFSWADQKASVCSSFRREWIRVKGSNAQEYPTCLPWGAIHLRKWAGPEVLLGLDQARTASSWEDARRNQTQMYVSTYKLEVFKTGIFVWGCAEGDVCSPEDVCHLRLKLEIRNLLLGCSRGSVNHQWEPNIQAIL